MSAPTPTSYDAVPYDSHPLPLTHPDRLAALATLFGLTPADPRACRVLEMGCAAGGNLIALAAALPQSRFVGVDLSAVQVRQGQRVIDALGLRNVALHAASITDVDAGFGHFDYVIAHGVYSWVPDAVQERLLAVCADRLDEAGVAYVSYNTLPGWGMRGVVRDAMRFQAIGFAEPAQRVAQARAMLDFLAGAVPADGKAYGALLRAELEALRAAPDYYLLHEHLEEVNAPLYFHEFVARAARHGLQYLAEAELQTMLASNFPPAVSDTIQRIAPDVMRQEQLMDFLRNRTFRQSLLVADGHRIGRQLSPARIRALALAACLQPVNAPADLQQRVAETLRAPNGGTLVTAAPATRAAMRVLAARWPQAMDYGELLGAALQALGGDGTAADASAADESLAADLLQAAAAGLVELHAMPSPFVVSPPARPVASALARWQAAQGLSQVSTLRNETLLIDAAVGRLLPLLDGTRDRADVAREAARWASTRPGGGAADAAHAQQLAHAIDTSLQQLGRAALLVA